MLLKELTEAGSVIGGSFQEKVNAIKAKSVVEARQHAKEAENPRAYFEGNRTGANYTGRKTAMDYDKNLEVASLGLDMAELQKSQRYSALILIT